MFFFCFLEKNERKYVLPMFDIMGYIINFCIFYFFLDKATGLIEDKQKMFRLLNIFFSVNLSLSIIQLILQDILFVDEFNEWVVKLIDEFLPACILFFEY